MALINSQHIRREDIPHEPGEWVEIRPVTAGQISDLQKDSGEESSASIAIRTLAGCIVAWSYDAAVSVESLRELDYETFTWLETKISITSGLRTEEEKKSSASPSSGTSAPAMVSSPKNSRT